MASAIDATKPADSSPALTSDLRANLLTAKNEISALQTAVAAAGDFKSDGTVAMTGAITSAIGAANVGVMSATGYSLTGANATSMLSLTGTLNTSGSPDVLQLNLTDTASAASTNLVNLKVGGTSKFAVRKNGHVVLGVDGGNNSVIVGSGQYLELTSSSFDIFLSPAGTRVLDVTNTYVGILPGKVLGFSTGATALPRTAFAENASGVMEVNNGTAGTFRDLKLRNEIMTGVFATSAAAPTIASAGTIAPTTTIAFVSGTTTISTITAPSPISAGGGQITLIPTGLWATNTAGNIALATTAVVSKALTMTYDVTTAKWYPSY